MWHKHRSIPHFSLFNSHYFFLLGSKIPEQPCKMNHMGAPNGCPPYIKAEQLLYTSVCVTPVIVCVSLKESSAADAPRAKPSRQEEMMSTTIGCCSDSGLDRQSDRQPVRLSTACCSSQAGTEPRALRREHSGMVHIQRASRKHLHTKHSSWISPSLGAPVCALFLFKHKKYSLCPKITYLSS